MNKTIKCKVCDKKAYKNNLCQRHYMIGVREMEKWITEARTREVPYRATHVKEKVGLG